MDSTARNRIIIIGGALLVVLFFAGLFTGIIPGLRHGQENPSVNLAIWGTYDSESDFRNLIDGFKKQYGGTKVTYREIDPERYESELINALAAGTGPDIFMIHNTWLPKHIDKLIPANAQTYPIVAYRNLFPQVVLEDFTSSSSIYASPLYLDTMAMFYNRDLFDKKAVALPPANWTEFENVVKKLKEVNPKTNEIIKAGAAIGGTEKSINRAADLLNLLMLQSGTQMVDPDYSRATFASALNTESGSAKKPGLDSLSFYTKFSNPASPDYTWNENLHYSVDNFAEGGVGIIFNYAHQIPVIKSKNPFLNFGVAPMPQISLTDQPVNYANYWGLAVSNKSKNPDWAWNFIFSVTAKTDMIKSYLAATAKPPALKVLINDKINDPDLGVFAKQALTARSWPQVDNNLVSHSFSDMIAAVIAGKLTPEAALQKSEDEITELMRLKSK